MPLLPLPAQDQPPLSFPSQLKPKTLKEEEEQEQQQ
jgi:hypothetical protein